MFCGQFIIRPEESIQDFISSPEPDTEIKFIHTLTYWRCET